MAAGFSNARDIILLLGINYFLGLFVALLLSGFFGLFFYKFILSQIYWAIGKVFQGKATKKETQLVLAYSLVPNLIYLIIGLIMIIPALLTNNLGLINYQHPVTIYVLWIFSFRILIYGLACFNKFSYGYALLTAILPFAILQVIIYSIRYLIL